MIAFPGVKTGTPLTVGAAVSYSTSLLPPVAMVVQQDVVIIFVCNFSGAAITIGTGINFVVTNGANL